jgi:hypothetical protein
MAEKQFKYTAKIKQPQTVSGVKLDPKGGTLTERQYKAVQKDKYGASLLEKGLLEVVEDTPEAPASSGETVPDFEQNGKTEHDFDQTGWEPPK